MSNQKKFKWLGINSSGNQTNGVITAQSLKDAKTELNRRGIIIKNLNEERELLSFGHRIKSKNITVFIRQLATLLESGLPLTAALKSICDGSDNPKFKELINSIMLHIESGNTLTNALNRHSKYFDELTVNLVKAGESSGTLDIILNRIASYKESLDTLKSKIKKALYYPLTIMLITTIITTLLIIFLVPLSSPHICNHLEVENSLYYLNNF